MNNVAFLVAAALGSAVQLGPATQVAGAAAGIAVWLGSIAFLRSDRALRASTRAS
jgi:hypothetical protein